MKKLTLTLALALIVTLSYTQVENVQDLQHKIDSLERRLDEKNYTRVPNQDLEEEFRSKVKEEVNGWFSSNFLVGGGILAAVVALVLTVGRRMITRELDDKLKAYVNDKTNDLVQKFNEHRETIKEDFKDLKESINNKLGDTNEDIKKYKDDSLAVLDRYKKDTEEAFAQFVEAKFNSVEAKVSELQVEMNETVNPLFNQSVEGILQRSGGKKNEKDEELIKYLEKLFKKGKLPSEKSATEALDAIIRYYYYGLNTDKMIALIDEYGSKYNLTATSYANAGLAFIDKYEASNQQEFHDSCVKYCDEAIKKTFDYGIPYAVKLFLYSIDYTRAFDDASKEAAADNIKKVFHQIKFTRSNYIAKEILDRIEVSRNSFLKNYIEQLQQLFADDLEELKQRVEPAEPSAVVKNIV